MNFTRTIFVILIMAIISCGCASNTEKSHSTEKEKDTFWENGKELVVDIKYDDLKSEAYAQTRGIAKIQKNGKYEDRDLWTVKIESDSDEVNPIELLFYFDGDKIFRIEENQDSEKKIQLVYQNEDFVYEANETNADGSIYSSDYSYSIKNTDEGIVYHKYNPQVETGYYETIVFDKNKNIVSYETGYGAGRELKKVEFSDNVKDHSNVTSDISKNETESNYVEYDETILDDIYIGNDILSAISSGRNIEQVINMYEPSYVDAEGYYYNISGGRQLKISVLEDGKINGMYFDNKNKISIEKLQDIEKCADINDVKRIIADVHIFYNVTKILWDEKAKLENPFCEICFENNDTCVISFDSSGNVVDVYHHRYVEK